MKNTMVRYLNDYAIVIDKDNVFTLMYHQIETIECDKPYIKVTLTDKSKYHFTSTIKDFNIHLPSYFELCNKSVLVNLLHIKEIRKTDNGFELVINERTIHLSRRKIKLIKTKFIEFGVNNLIEIG